MGRVLVWENRSARHVRHITSRPQCLQRGPRGNLALVPLFPAPALDAGVLPKGFPVLREGGFGSEGGASMAISLAGCFSPDLRLCDLMRSFMALRALKKPSEVLGALRTSRIKVNITSFILARGRDLVMGTSLSVASEARDCPNPDPAPPEITKSPKPGPKAHL